MNTDSLFVRSLASGSSGNCYLVRTRETALLIDAGISCRSICERLGSFCDVSYQDIAAVLITHEHIDHTRGVPVFNKKTSNNGCVLAASEGTWNALGQVVDFSKPDNALVFLSGHSFKLADLEITPFSTSHDAAESVGFLIQQDTGVRIGFVTDLGIFDAVTVDMLHDCDLIIAESNHDPRMLQTGPYPAYLKKRIAGRLGHLSNTDCASMLVESLGRSCKAIWLSHLSEENNRPQLAYTATHDSIDAAGRASHVDIEVLPRTVCGPVFRMS